MKPSITTAIVSLVPNAAFSIDELSVINWQCALKKPTKNQIDAELLRLEKAYIVKTAKDRIINSYRTDMNLLTAGYNDLEQKTWQTQIEQAKLYVANNLAITPAFDALTIARGTTKAALAPNIIAKASALELASLTLTGKYQKLIADIDLIAASTTTTQAALDAVVW